MQRDWKWAKGRASVAVVLAALVVGAALGAGFSGGAPREVIAQQQAPVAKPAVVPSSFSDLVERLSTSVVNIRVTKVEKATGPFMGPGGEAFPGFPGMPEELERFFRDRQQQPPREFRQRGAGSGFIINKSGLILTNNHVVEGAKDVLVTLANKEEYPAKVIGRDPKTDMALIKIEPKSDLPVAALGDSGSLKVGDWVLAIGNPFGLANTVTAGIVSAKGRVIGAGPYDDFIQTDASINPGNSGGPLFNLRGEVVGINTAINPAGQGIGFAVPVNIAKSLLPQLETKGEVTRGWLGVSVQAITPELAKGLGLSERKGALVADVTKDGPAAAAGVQRGDVVVKFGDQDISDVHNLPMVVAGTEPGKQVPMVVKRGGKEQTIQIKVGKMPSEKPEVAEAPAEAEQGKWGLALRELDSETAQRLNVSPREGVLIAGVQSGSPAEEAGLRTGDVVLEVNREKVTSVKEAQEAVRKQKKDEPLVLLLRRGESSLYAALQPK
jgi:serine protease Do